MPLTVDITITEEYIQTKKCIIVKNSKEEYNFLTKLIETIKGLNTGHILSKEILEWTIQKFANDMEKIWFKHLKIINITKHSKSWWNMERQRELDSYRSSKSVED